MIKNVICMNSHNLDILNCKAAHSNAILIK